jgi:hypothetical protein
MRNKKQLGAVDDGAFRQRQVVHPGPIAIPEVGDHFIGPSGRIWTVQSVVPRGNRIVLTRPADDGLAAFVVDFVALGRMVRLRRTRAWVPAIDRRRASSAPPTVAVLTRSARVDGRTPAAGCARRRRVLVHLSFDDSHHAHVDAYESVSV